MPIERLLVIAAIGIVSMGCFERTLRPVNPCTRSRVGNNIRVESVDKVDLLFMIDNSNSMAEEQASLADQLPRLVRVLASGDRNGNGVRDEGDFDPVQSLHIGVITSDMGTGGFNVPTCSAGTFGSQYGDDGVLITRGRGGGGCMATYPPVFEFRPADSGADPDAFASQVACVATAGTGGCGFEQQLEAVLKAVSPANPQSWTIPNYEPPRFLNSTTGHADGQNAGFIRPDSALAIILVTDEEDCSAANPELFNPMAPEFVGVDLNLRCFSFPNEVHPIERYVRGAGGHSGLLGLRQNPNLLIFAGIVGVPVETVPDPSSIDYDRILNHELMQEEVDPTMPTRLRPSCNVPGRGVAFPPRRIVRTAQEIERAGGSATIQSICQESYAGALDAIIAKIADALGGACLPRALNPDAEGFVQCSVYEILPAGQTCTGLPGRSQEPGATTLVEVNGEIREQCTVIQVGPAGVTSGEPGWFYENALNARDDSLLQTCQNNPQRIAFVNTSPTTNAEIRLECLQAIRSASADDVSIGAFCDPEADMCGRGSTPSGAGTLSCDAATRTCGVPCGTNADCTEAGLFGDVCDTRPWEDAVGATDLSLTEAERERRRMAIPPGVDPQSPHGFCVNPTCI